MTFTKLQKIVTTETYCEICHEDHADTTEGICSACWEASAAPGGVHADLPVTIVAEGDGTPCVDLTLGAFVADNPELLSAQDIVTLLALPLGDSLTFGGGAAPLFWLSRREV